MKKCKKTHTRDEKKTRERAKATVEYIMCKVKINKEQKFFKQIIKKI